MTAAPPGTGATPNREVSVAFDVACTMRDGTVLRCNLYRPVGVERSPVLIVRVPYGKDSPGLATVLDPAQAARRGYAVVVQDVRGRFASDGDFAAYRHDGQDGADTVAWAAGAPWSNGRVGMFGTSYSGMAQWLAVREGAPALQAIAPMNSWCDAFDGYWYRGGVFELGRCAHQSLSLGLHEVARARDLDDGERAARSGRLVTALDALAREGYASSPPERFAPIVDNEVGPEFLEAVAAHADPTRAAAVSFPGARQPHDVPAYCVGGWFDPFLQGTIDHYLGLRERGTPARLLIGPWTHLVQRNPIGERSFGTASQALNADLVGRQLRWFDRWLSERTPHDPEEPPIELFTMGRNQWRTEQTWPPARAVDTPFHLRSGGRLSLDPPAAEAPDEYDDDLRVPVPTHGGAIMMAPDFLPGPRDQRVVEQRADVLTYTSDALVDELGLTGPVSARLWVTSSASSADFVVRLCDVHPDGRSFNLADGVARIDIAAGAGNAVEVAVSLWATSVVLLPGHRIRVQVASSCFPRWARNPRREPLARHAVFHDPARPSHVVLPVVR